jgi:formate hydrogenlyase subunit 3/multisubunit Na+/H+ antiporter MnhD subunit
MIGLGCTNDLFNLWIWFEAMAVTSYLLVAFYKDLPTSLEAGIKYLVQSAAGSILVLLAIGLVVAEHRACGGGDRRSESR